MWRPWNRQHKAIQIAQQGLVQAALEAAEAEERRKEAERLARQSLTVTARLRKEIDKNGWTELLQHAMGGR